eukprot:5086334-Heterocapsa_arctica.AAC.1
MIPDDVITVCHDGPRLEQRKAIFRDQADRASIEFDLLKSECFDELLNGAFLPEAAVPGPLEGDRPPSCTEVVCQFS